MEKVLIYLEKYLSKNKLIFKFFISLFFVGFFNSNIHSQTIQVINQKNKKPISSVLVEIEKINNSIEKKYGFSDKNGYLKYNLKPTFKINASHIGYKKYEKIFERKDILDTLFIFLEPLYHPLEEVVVTGQIGDQNRSKSMNNFIIISKKKIENTASNNLGELLSNEALFDLNIDPALGTSLSIQGMQGNNVNILIDGIPMIGRKGSQIDLGQIDLSNIDQIEILKGPASVTYGTNSTGGVINLITKKKKDQIKFN